MAATTTKKPWWETTRLDVSRRGAQVAIDELLEHGIAVRVSRSGKDIAGQPLTRAVLISNKGFNVMWEAKHYSAGAALTQAIREMVRELNNGE